MEITYAASDTRHLSSYFKILNEKVSDDVLKKSISEYQRDPGNLSRIINNSKMYRDNAIFSKDTYVMKDKTLSNFPEEEPLSTSIECIQNILEICNYRINRNIFLKNKLDHLLTILNSSEDSNGTPITVNRRMLEIKNYFS